MTLIDHIRQLALTAKKARDTKLDTLLVTLYSEASMVGKNAGNRPSTDQEVIQTIKKFIKNCQETQKIRLENGLDINIVAWEIEVLSGLLPQQLTEIELRAVVTKIKNEVMPKSSGQLMGLAIKELNKTNPGQVDSAILKSVAEEVFADTVIVTDQAVS